MINLENIDRRIIYLFVGLALSIPLIFRWKLEPAPMETADKFYEAVDNLTAENGKIVLIASDWSPSTKAENEPQTEVLVEHLMRKRVPFALISILAHATPFLRSIPERVAEKLEKETGEKWEYGKDWVNLGFRPGGIIMIQGFAKADDIKDFFTTDAQGTPLKDIPAIKDVKDIRDISMLAEFTGSVGAFEMWLQFFQAKGYNPPYVHGTTSISIPGVYIYYLSKQIVGLHEGVAGAAWYEKLLNDNYPKREEGNALVNNTSLAYAHLAIILLIILGNLTALRGAKNA